jgi:sulfur carrier protein ThiS
MSSIKVTIRSYDVITAALPEELRADREMGKPLVVELKENAKVVDIFTELPWLANPIEDTVVVFINGEAATINSTLQAGDVLDIMTPSGGG